MWWWCPDPPLDTGACPGFEGCGCCCCDDAPDSLDLSEDDAGTVVLLPVLVVVVTGLVGLEAAFCWSGCPSLVFFFLRKLSPGMRGGRSGGREEGALEGGATYGLLGTSSI